MESHIGDATDVRRFAMVGEDLVGQRHFAGDISAIIDIHAADASY